MERVLVSALRCLLSASAPLTARAGAQDGTLVVTRAGSGFAKDPTDYRFLHGETVAALRTLHAAGYRIVVFRRARGAVREAFS